MNKTLLKRASCALICASLVLISNPSLVEEKANNRLRPVQTAQAKGKFVVSHSKVARGTAVTVKGWLPQKGKKVKIQRLVGRRWQTVKEAQVTATGNFKAKVTINKRTVLRGYSSKFNNLATLSARVKVVDPQAVLTSIPPLGGPGVRPNVQVPQSQILAKFTPALSGQEVILERKNRKKWVRVAAGRQTEAGAVALDAVPGEKYRVRAGSYRSKPILADAFPLLFSEDFDTLDPSIWPDQPRMGASGRTCSVSGPEARHVSKGVLKLTVMEDPRRAHETCNYTHKEVASQSPYLLSSQVATSRSFSFTYGYAAARVKLHSNPGAHFGFWLLPYRPVMDPAQPWNDVSFVPNDPTQGAEVDIVEYWAHNRNGQEPRIGSFLHWYGVDGLLVHFGFLYPEANKMKAAHETWDNSYHVYSVRWTPDYYEFMVDGHVYARVEENVTQVPEYLVLSMLASDYELNKRNPNLQDEAEVDWVRVWGLQ